MLFIILRVVRESVFETGNPVEQTAIKFFPVRHAKGHPDEGEPVLLDAEDAQDAFKLTKWTFPLLAHSLAVQPLKDFQNDLAKFAALRAQSGEHPRSPTGRIIRNEETRRPFHQVPNPRRGNNPPR